jgi:hypothetical protein
MSNWSGTNLQSSCYRPPPRPSSSCMERRRAAGDCGARGPPHPGTTRRVSAHAQQAGSRPAAQTPARVAFPLRMRFCFRRPHRQQACRRGQRGRSISVAARGGRDGAADRMRRGGRRPPIQSIGINRSIDPSEECECRAPVVGAGCECGGSCRKRRPSSSKPSNECDEEEERRGGGVSGSGGRYAFTSLLVLVSAFLLASNHCSLLPTRSIHPSIDSFIDRHLLAWSKAFFSHSNQSTHSFFFLFDQSTNNPTHRQQASKPPGVSTLKKIPRTTRRTN